MVRIFATADILARADFATPACVRGERYGIAFSCHPVELNPERWLGFEETVAGPARTGPNGDAVVTGSEQFCDVIRHIQHALVKAGERWSQNPRIYLFAVDVEFMITDGSDVNKS